MSIAISVKLDSMASSSIRVREITTLNHEVIDDSVEDGAIIATHDAQECEVLCMDWGSRVIQFKCDVSEIVAHLELNVLCGRCCIGDAAICGVIMSKVKQCVG